MVVGMDTQSRGTFNQVGEKENRHEKYPIAKCLMG